MAKQLTAPGCKYSIVARVDTTIYSPDQKWTLDIPAGQSDFIAETNEIIIPADAMMCPKLHQIDEDTARVTLLGRGVGSLATFVTRAIEQIVGKGNVTVAYEEGKMTVVLAASVTAGQVAAVESMLQRLLPKDVEPEVATANLEADFLESTGTQYISIRNIPIDNDLGGRCDYVDFNPINDTPMLSGTRTGGGDTPRFYLPYTSSGIGYYGWKDWVQLGAYNNAKQRTVGLLNYFNDRKYKMSYGDTVVSGTLDTTLPLIDGQFLSLFCYFSQPPVQRYITGQVYSMQLTRAEELVCNFISAIDSAGTPCMYDTVTGQNFYNQGTGSFTIGFDTTEKAAISLSKLPVTTNGTLTVSLPAEAENTDTLVPAAIDIAKSRGWTIITQYRTN